MLRLVGSRAAVATISRCASALRAPAQPIVRAMSSKSASKADIYALSGVSEEIFTKRKVVIYRPTRSAMTQGRADTKRPWKLMEAAIEYCQKYGIEYTVQPYEESTVNKTVAKQYADNFLWDGDEETGDTGMGHWATRRSGTK